MAILSARFTGRRLYVNQFIEVHNHLRNIKALAAQGQSAFLKELQASSSNCRVNDAIIISVLFLWSKYFNVMHWACSAFMIKQAYHIPRRFFYSVRIITHPTCQDLRALQIPLLLLHSQCWENFVERFTDKDLAFLDSKVISSHFNSPGLTDTDYIAVLPPTHTHTHNF